MSQIERSSLIYRVNEFLKRTLRQILYKLIILGITVVVFIVCCLFSGYYYCIYSMLPCSSVLGWCGIWLRFDYSRRSLLWPGGRAVGFAGSFVYPLSLSPCGASAGN